MAKRYWLMKSEPDVFSIDDLRNRPAQTEPWDGVRNYQARNFMRDEMRPGDGVFFYHSNCAEPAIVGLAEVAGKPRPDETAFDPNSPYYDPKSDRHNPRWFLVDVKWKETFSRQLPLSEIKDDQQLQSMLIARRGNRLSITPVSAAEAKVIQARCRG